METTGFMPVVIHFLPTLVFLFCAAKPRTELLCTLSRQRLNDHRSKVGGLHGQLIRTGIVRFGMRKWSINNQKSTIISTHLAE